MCDGHAAVGLGERSLPRHPRVGPGDRGGSLPASERAQECIYSPAEKRPVV